MSKDEQARDHHAIAWSTSTRALWIFSASCSARLAGAIWASESFTITLHRSQPYRAAGQPTGPVVKPAEPSARRESRRGVYHISSRPFSVP